MTEAEFTGSEIVDELDAQVDDSFVPTPQNELDEQLAEIVQAQNLIDEIELQLNNPSSPQIAEKHGAAFITQGAVGWVESRVRGGFGTQAEIEANKQLEQLIKDAYDEHRSKLLVRVGRKAILPFEINPFTSDHQIKPKPYKAEPYDKKHALQQGSMIELSHFYEDIPADHGDPRDMEPQSYAGKGIAFIPIAWIGRILNDEGQLVLKPRERNDLF